MTVLTGKARKAVERLFPMFADSTLQAGLTPKLAKDAAFDTRQLTRDITPANWTQERKRKLADDVVKALKTAKLAKDADPDDVQGVLEVLDTLDEVKEQIAPVIAEAAGGDMPPDMKPDEAKDADADEMTKVRDFLSDKLSPEDLQTVMNMLHPGDAPDPTEDKFRPAVKRALRPGVPAGVSKPAMDAAIAEAVKAAEERAIQSTVDRMKSAQIARQKVHPIMGNLDFAFDSADRIYEETLDANGIERKGVHPSAYPALVDMLMRTKTQQRAQRPAAAMDSDHLADIYKRFPGAAHLKSV